MTSRVSTFAPLVFVLLAACAEEQTLSPLAPTGVPARPTGGGRAPPPPALVPMPTESLDARTWTALGMPPPDRTWTGADYTAAVTVLRGKSAGSYPRAGDAESGEVFARFIATENLARLRDTTLSFDARFPEALEMGNGVKQILELYVVGVREGAPLRRESLGLLAFLVDHAVVAADLIAILAARLDPKASIYPKAVESFEEIQRGMALTSIDVVAVLPQTDVFAVEDLGAYARTLRPTLPKLVSRLRPDARAEVLSKLRGVASAERNSGYATVLRELDRVVEAEPVSPLQIPTARP